MDIFKQIDELQSWLQEYQVKGSDSEFNEKAKQLQDLMKQAYKFN